MIVDIRKIKKSLNPRGQKVPVMAEYDSLWGFYTMSQTINYTYEESGKNGYSVATVTINGYFTTNAEQGKIIYNYPNESIEKQYSFDLFSKYKTLRDQFVIKSSKQPPKSLSDYGTIRDERCIALPSKLKDQNGDLVYMRPVSIGLVGERSPVLLQYTAILSEVKTLPCQIAIGSDSDIIEDAKISITGMRPRINPLLYAFSNGGEHVFTGYDNRKISISGDINGNYVDSSGSGVILGDVDVDRISEDGFLKVKIKNSSNTRNDVFDIYVDNSSVIFNKDKGNTSVIFSGELINKGD